jgi:hypothetical protein
VDPNGTIGLDPETMLQAENAFSGGGQPNPQLGQSMASPAPPTQPPPFVPDQPIAPPVADATGAPPAATPGLGDQTLPLDEPAPAPAPEPPAAPPTGADVSTTAQPAPVVPATLGPPPTPPPLTGDPAKDSQANLEYHRQLTAYSDHVQQHGADLAQKTAELNQKKADRELQMEQNAATIRNDEAKRFATENAQRRAAIDKAVTDKTQAYGDLSKGNGFLDQSLGDKVMGAIIFMLGSRQQALMNVAMIQSGHAPTAQNEGLNYINKLMEQRYQQKKDRLAAANDSVLEARYGFKDALENHQAAIADLDADAAANYRLAAKEAASQGAQLGSEQARQAGLQAHAELMQKSAEYEQKMLHDQAELQQKKEASEASLENARVHLDQGERQIQATLAQHKETNAEARERLALARDESNLRHQDRQDAAAARKEAAAAKKADAEDARTARDPETGDPMGIAPSARQVPEIEKSLVASHAYSASLRALADDVEKNGRVGSDLPIVGTDAGRRRSQLYADAIERGRPAMQLGVSNANLQLEHQGAGGSGVGFDLHQTADPKVLRRMADEQDALAAKRARGILAPIGGKPVAPIAGREMSETKPAGASPPQKVIDQAWNAVNDPKAAPKIKQKAMEALTAAGLL